MNAKQMIIAIAVFAAAGSAFAQQREFVAPDANFTPAKTRAEVIAELNQAYADGTLVPRDGEDTVVVVNARRSRDDVHSKTPKAGQTNSNHDLYFGA